MLSFSSTWDPTYLRRKSAHARCLGLGPHVDRRGVPDLDTLGREASVAPAGVPARLSLQPPARLQAVHVAEHVELEHHRRMVGGPAGGRRPHPLEAERAEIELVDEGVDDADRVLGIDVVVEAVGKESGLPAILAFDETPHPEAPRVELKLSIFEHVSTRPRPQPVFAGICRAEAVERASGLSAGSAPAACRERLRRLPGNPGGRRPRR